MQAFATPIPTLICPSDPAPVISTELVSGYSYAGNNYMVSTGSGQNLLYDQRFQTDGVTYCGASIRLASVIDGLSKTIFMSESIRSAGVDITVTPPVRSRRFRISTRSTDRPG